MPSLSLVYIIYPIYPVYSLYPIYSIYPFSVHRGSASVPHSRPSVLISPLLWGGAGGGVPLSFGEGLGVGYPYSTIYGLIFASKV